VTFNFDPETQQVPAVTKYHPAKCSSSRVIVQTEKELSNDAENNTVVATADSNYEIKQQTKQLPTGQVLGHQSVLQRHQTTQNNSLRVFC